MGQTLSEPIVDKVSVACLQLRSLCSGATIIISIYYLPIYLPIYLPTCGRHRLPIPPPPPLCRPKPHPPLGLPLRALSLSMLFAICASCAVERVPHPPRAPRTGSACPLTLSPLPVMNLAAPVFYRVVLLKPAMLTMM